MDYYDVAAKDYYLVKGDRGFSLYTAKAYKVMKSLLTAAELVDHRRVPISAHQMQAQFLDHRYPVFDLETSRSELYITNWEKL